MDSSAENQKIVERFAVVTEQFCNLVDAASTLSREEFLTQVYSILPKMIDQAICMPEVVFDDSDEEAPGHADRWGRARLGNEEWQQLYDLLKEKLGDWDSYLQVFDPTKDSEAIGGSLADDLADIYRDLKNVLVKSDTHPIRPEDKIWEWRFSYCSHWGKHAIDVLHVLHFRLHY